MVDCEHSDSQSRFGCSHYLLLEVGFWVTALIGWAVVKPVFTPRLVVLALLVGATLPLVAALVVVARNTLRGRNR